jgi:hypothetical protein
VILSKFWSRYDLQNFRKLNFLGDDQGELSKGTVLNLVLNLVRPCTLGSVDSIDEDTGYFPSFFFVNECCFLLFTITIKNYSK